MNVPSRFDRRHAALAALVGCALAALATSPAHWQLTARATGQPVVLSTANPTATRRVIVRANAAATPREQTRQWGGSELTLNVRPELAPGAESSVVVTIAAEGSAAGRPSQRGQPAYALSPDRCAPAAPCERTFIVTFTRAAGASASELSVPWRAEATVGNRGDSTPPTGAAVDVSIAP